MRWPRIFPDRSNWQEWYAWRPVFISHGRRAGLFQAVNKWVWLEVVQRRYVDAGNLDRIMKWQYCLPGEQW